jgi:hypothetical protein
MSAWFNNKLACVSSANYATGYGGDLDANKNWTTISKMSECNGVWHMKKGDQVKLEALFDEVQHPA